jgi:hypothetical protein
MPGNLIEFSASADQRPSLVNDLLTPTHAPDQEIVYRDLTRRSYEERVSV